MLRADRTYLWKREIPYVYSKYILFQPLLPYEIAPLFDDDIGVWHLFFRTG